MQEKWSLRIAGLIVLFVLFFGGDILPRRKPPPPPPPPETILGAVEPLASVGQAEHLPNELPPSKPVPGAAPPPPGALATNDAEMLSDEDTPAPGPRISRPKYDFSQNIDARAEEIERQSPQERAKKTIFRVQVSAVHDRPTALALKEKLLALNAQYRIDLPRSERNQMYLVQIEAPSRDEAKKIADFLKKHKYTPYIKEY